MQSKKSSLIESLLNVGSGWVIATLTWMYIIAPLWDFEVTMSDNLTITGIFTIISIVRGYAWRRAFNLYHVKQLNKAKA